MKQKNERENDMFKRSTFFLVVASFVALPSLGNATNCSCWTTLGGRSSGSLCKLYTEGEYSYTLPECQGVCKFAGGNNWAYIDSSAYSACMETFKDTAKVTCKTGK